MGFMKHLGLLSWTVLGLVLGLVATLGLGCAQNRQAQGYGAPPDSPADDGATAAPLPTDPAYAAQPAPATPPPLQESAPPQPPPASVSDVDHEVAGAIHRLLNQDEFLAPGSKNVTAKVKRGVVTLRGTVPAAHYRDQIALRVGQLPGVDRVRNELELEGPH